MLYYNTMSSIMNFIKKIKFNSNQPKILGRWTIDHGSRMNRKIDLANVDNCGPCGSEPNEIKNTVINNDEYDYDYYLPYLIQETGDKKK